MELLTREQLTDDEWSVLRATPKFVLLAVSTSGGSRLDAVLERSAGSRAVENGRNNDHPLVRQLAEPAEILAAAATVRQSVRGRDSTLREAEEMLALARSNARAAADVIRRRGGELDLRAYRDFVVGIARTVAEAAREGDFIGLGGQQVSDAERAVIVAVSQAFTR